MAINFCEVPWELSPMKSSALQQPIKGSWSVHPNSIVYSICGMFFLGSLEKFNIIIQVHPTDQLYYGYGTSHRSYLGSGTSNHPLSQHHFPHPGLLEQRASDWWSAGKLLKNTLSGWRGFQVICTLQGINISYLGKFGKSSTQKCQALWDMLVPRRFFLYLESFQGKHLSKRSAWFIWRTVSPRNIRNNEDS